MRHRLSRPRASWAAFTAAVVLSGVLSLTTSPAGAAPAASPAPKVFPPPSVPAGDRADLLGADWSSSPDVAWTTSGDADGFHLLTAAGSSGYTWKTLATLAEPGFDADSWIGNACTTGTGRYAVVVYAPRTFTNKPELMARGGFTAVVNLVSGAIRKLPVLASLSYYNPGCGIDDTAVLTQSGTDDRPGTRLLHLDAHTGRTTTPVLMKGQVTSAVPGPGSTTLGARGAQVVRLDTKGRAKTVARTNGVPFRLTRDARGGLLYLDHRGATATARHLSTAALTRPDAAKAAPVAVASGPLTGLGVTRSRSTAYVTGPSRSARTTAPAGIGLLPKAAKDTQISTHGTALVSHQQWADGKGTLLQPGQSNTARPFDLALTLRASGRTRTLRAVTAKVSSRHAADGRAASPGLRAAGSSTSGNKRISTFSSSPSDPDEDERTCSVPRNDPANQAMQPKPRQVEWAVDQAIQGYLNTHISRPADWKNLGMPAYSPQSLFLNPALEGGGRAMAQVMLGVTTQESNMWQAGREAVPGVTANPLIGNYYGIDLYDGDTSNDWDVNFAKADCGYGITQVTDHMRMAGREDGHGGAAWNYQKQRAAALDYTANIAAGLQILIAKWNETRAAGMIANHGTTGRPENWYFALWAYNSGFHPDQGNGAPWGLGWANNPANPEWDAGRLPFMENAAGGEDASAAARPQNWPYQEKVLGFAAHPPSFLESPAVLVPAFRPATWNGTNASVSTKGSALYNRAHLKAPEDAFCEPTSNDCFPGRISDSASNDSGSLGPCGREDFMCWWHKPVTWKTDCVDTCGYEFLRFSTSMGEEPDGVAYPPQCTVTGLPSGALIVDDVPQGTAVHRPGCDNSGWTNNGSFSFDFGNNGSESVYPSKVDLHQLGAGFGGHFWFGHTRADDAKGNRLKISGTWKLNKSLDGQATVMVHLPDHGAQTHLAKYEITVNGGTRTRTISQDGNTNRWVPLGAFRFNNVPQVKLTTIAANGTGDEDIAFDAVAFVPGHHSGVDITLPEPDPNAPNVAWDSINKAQDMQAPDFESVPPDPAGPGASSRAVNPDAEPYQRKGWSCGTPNAKGIAGCSRIVASKDKMTKLPPLPPRKQNAARVASTFDPIVSWCTNTRGSHKYTRFEGCFHSTYEYIAVDKDGSTFAEQDFDLFQQVKLNQKSRYFTQRMEVWPVGTLDPKLANITLDVHFNCFDPDTCASETEQWSSSLTWLPGDAHIATAVKEHRWTNFSSERGWDVLGFNWKVQGYAPVAGPTAVKIYAPDLLPQCDNFAINNTEGCSFGTYQPTYQFNSAKYPAAAAHAWLIQEALPSHAGSKKYDSPMNYLPDKKNQFGRPTQKNRDVICPSPYQYHDDTTLLPELVGSGGNDVKSCDEYAFASTYQSAGMPSSMNGRNEVGSGDACVQTYATRVQQGTWKLYDDDRYPLPTFKEVCGRSSMSQWQNGGSMNRFAGFASYFRLLDSDSYWVDIPGFDGCTAKAPLVRCTMTP